MDSNVQMIRESLQKPQQLQRKEEMDKDTFLKLMMVQMRYQDPLAPMDNSQMLAQMAQFSSLEQMSQLNKNFSESASVSHFMNATRLIGKEIAMVDPSSSPDSPSAVVSKVRSVSSTDEGALLHLENGWIATMDEIVWVGEPGERQVN